MVAEMIHNMFKNMNSNINMSKLDSDSYDAHQDATPGDRIPAVETDGDEYEGTPVQLYRSRSTDFNFECHTSRVR